MNTLLEFQPVRKRGLASQVMDNIKEYIISNNLVAGDRLPSERKLTEMLGVSKTILREALKSLESVGIVKINSGNGVFVSEMDYLGLVDNLSFALQIAPHEFKHLVRTRIAVEVGALDEVIENIGDDDFKELERLCDEFERVESVDEYIAVECEFHRGLIAASRNPLLVELSSFFHKFFAQVAPMVAPEDVKDGPVLDAGGHREILELLRSGDLAAVQSKLRQHIGGRYL